MCRLRNAANISAFLASRLSQHCVGGVVVVAAAPTSPHTSPTELYNSSCALLSVQAAECSEYFGGLGVEVVAAVCGHCARRRGRSNKLSHESNGVLQPEILKVSVCRLHNAMIFRRSLSRGRRSSVCSLSPTSSLFQRALTQLERRTTARGIAVMVGGLHNGPRLVTSPCLEVVVIACAHCDRRLRRSNEPSHTSNGTLHLELWQEWWMAAQ